jgi:hypothetical protein
MGGPGVMASLCRRGVGVSCLECSFVVSCVVVRVYVRLGCGVVGVGLALLL